MANEDRLFRWLADVYRSGYKAYVRFWCDFYDGAPALRAADLTYQTSRDDPEEAREKEAS
jgi:hypothetical protein